MQHVDAFLARFESLHPKKIDLTLGRTERLLGKLGNPERKLPPLIHVAGTNGKGSTIAFMRAILEAGGARVHVFTSPHLVRFHERIRLGRVGGGKLITDEQLAEACARIEAINAGDPITFFEITTAMALDLFHRHPADVVLMEVGLGGRFDSTNVIPNPAASVITPISLDHREHLGDTIAKIAFEKAGIIKHGSPVIIAEQTLEAMDVCLDQSARLGCVTRVGGQDFQAHEERGRLVYQADDRLLDLPLPRLLGRHQIGNAATAIATLTHVLPEWATPAAIEQGLQQVEWPARFQRLQGQLARLAPAGAELWLDGGHNEDGARVLAETLVSLEERQPRPLVLMMGTMARKDARAILKPFLGLAQELLAVPVAHSLARSPDELSTIAREIGLPAVSAGSVRDGLRFLAARTWPVAPRILIIGSLYLAGEVLQADGSLPS
jgi:dihydrofolate synthase/folylpolyglutamate synthase